MNGFEASLRNAQPANSSADASATVTPIHKAAADDSAVQSLSDQLSDLYAEIEYMTSKFPNQTVRSLTDLALAMQARMSGMQTSGPVADHGLIPGGILAKISQLTQDMADAAAEVGIVEVDELGVIKIYNKYESDLAGVARANAVGKNFFLEVAPCTNNRLFMGTFKSGVQSGNMDKKFNYTFTYKMKPTPVEIHLYRDAQSGRNLIFVKRR